MPTTEYGHAPNRWYDDQGGNPHINGSSLYINEAGSVYPAVPCADGLTAVGTNQAGALQLTGSMAKIATSTATASPFNGALLPPATAAYVGQIFILNNFSGNPIQVYGNGSDTINGNTNTLGLTQGTGTSWDYCCTALGAWTVQPTQSSQPGLVALSGTADALSPHLAHVYIVTKAGVDAMTLAAPTATTDDGIVITITSATANAHTLTATGLLQTGTANVNTATFAAQKGAGLSLMAYQAKWQVTSAVGITFS